MMQSRNIFGFFIAPLVAPISASFLMVWAAPNSASWIVGALIGLFAGYGGMLFLGIPAFLILRSLNWTGVAAALIFGFAIGVAMWILTLAYISLSFGGEAIDGIRVGLQDQFGAWWVLGGGMLGAMGGTIFWVIARPDRHQISN